MNRDLWSRSDDESETVDEVREEAAPLNDSGCLKWLKTSNQQEEEQVEDQKGKNESKKQKMLNKLLTFVDKLELTSAAKDIETLTRDALAFLRDEFFTKYHFVPQEVVDSFRTVQHGYEDWEQAMKQQSDEDTAERKALMAEAPTWRKVKQSLTQAFAFFEGKPTTDAEDASQEPAVVEKTKPTVETEEDLAAMLTKEFSNTKISPSEAQTWVRAATRFGKEYLVILANVKLFASYMDTAPQTGMPNESWKRAKKALEAAFDLACNFRGAITETDTWKLAENHVSIPGGWAVRATSLAHAIVLRYAFREEYAVDVDLVRLECEAAVLLARCLKHYVDLKQKTGIARAASALLEILHVRTPDAHTKINSVVPPFGVLQKPIGQVVDELVQYVRQYATQQEDRDRASLARVYNMCLQNEDCYIAARDMFRRECGALDDLRSPKSKVLYNRTVAVLGLSALRHGYFDAALETLNELCSKRPEEVFKLLGQRDLSKPRNARAESRSTETELVIEHELLVPAHRAIPVKLLEQAHLVLSTVHDLVQETKNPEDRQHRSNKFYKLCKRMENAPFSGPPRSDDDLIYAAYMALRAGQIDQAIALVQRMSGWTLLPPGSATLELLVHRIRVDGLKVFLISLGQYYKSLTVDELVSRFGLPPDTVRATFSRLLLDNAFLGHWNDDDTYVVIERGPQTKLHFQARECTERLTDLISVNDTGNRTERRTWGRGRGGYRGGGSAKRY